MLQNFLILVVSNAIYLSLKSRIIIHVYIKFCIWSTVSISKPLDMEMHTDIYHQWFILAILKVPRESLGSPNQFPLLSHKFMFN